MSPTVGWHAAGLSLRQPVFALRNVQLTYIQFIAPRKTQNEFTQSSHIQTAIMFTLRTALLALASAVAVSADYYIDPNSVDLITRSMSPRAAYTSTR